jgi:hypothetical protein
LHYLIIVTAVVASIYPAFVVLRPAAALRAQRTKTIAGSGARRSAGEFFGRMLRVAELDAPWQDEAALARVRWFGAAELVLIWVVALGLIVILA